MISDVLYRRKCHKSIKVRKPLSQKTASNLWTTIKSKFVRIYGYQLVTLSRGFQNVDEKS